jgi:pimeloyl-ACP methyl ester carboxylesterase
VRRLGLYEAPFIVDNGRPPMTDEYLADIDALVAADRRSDTVRQFMKAVGVPGIFIALMRFMPAWSKLTSVAHTLAYDHAILGDCILGRPLPIARWASATSPTLVMAGGKSPQWMLNAMRSLAGVLPNAQYRVLDGQTHMVKPKALAPVLADFFAG